MSEVKCKNCIHFERCSSIGINNEVIIHNPDGNTETIDCSNSTINLCDIVMRTKICDHFKDRAKFIELPFIAMIEKEIKGGKFNAKRTNRNGATAVVYFDKEKYSIPLIDITSQYYNYDEAKDRVAELKEGVK